MRRSRLGALVAVVTLGGAPACSREAPPVPEIKEPAPPSPPPPPSVAETAPSRAEPAPPRLPEPPAFRLTELAPTQGDLIPLLKDQAARAQRQKLRPVVEFYADWCPPCRAFQASLEDPRMAEALRGTFLMKASFDDWQGKLDGTGFKVDAVPLFYLVGDDGRPTGKLLDGDKWGKSTVPNMSAALSKFLAP